MTVILTTLVISLSTALVLGVLLGVFKKIFYVKPDPIASAIREALPGANCGGCGYPGCDGYAAAAASGDAPANGCTVGGSAVAAKVASVLGVETSAIDMVSLAHCRGTNECAAARGVYDGVQSCKAAKISCGGLKMCDWGCIGLGDCERVCPFGAIRIEANGLPSVDYSLCTGCGICVKECPQKILSLLPRGQKRVEPLCSNRNVVKNSILKMCKNGCIKCGKCERVCKENAIQIKDGLPSADYTRCTLCGDCVAACPIGALSAVSRG